MTPEIKAAQLVNKYFNFIYLDLDYEQAKHCALVAVDEIIKDKKAFNQISIEYWEDVKQEIKSL
jgi:hypothetical protein